MPKIALYILLLLTSTKATDTTNQIIEIMIKHEYKGTVATNIEIIIAECKEMGVTNELTQKAILSCIGKESGFIPRCEMSYKNTSNDRLRKIFGKRLLQFNEIDLTAAKSNDQLFFGVIYGGRFGNVHAGDGFAYRGRGFNQITFAANYIYYGKLTGLDLYNHPELLDDVNNAAKCAIAFFIQGCKNLHYDINGFTTQEDATYAMVRINNGGGDVSKSEGLANAKVYEKNFTIV